MESTWQIESGDPFAVVISKQLELNTVRLQCLQKQYEEIELQRSIGSLAKKTYRLKMEACKEQADVLHSMKMTGYEEGFFSAPLFPPSAQDKKAKVDRNHESAVRQSLAAVEKSLENQKEKLEHAGDRFEALVLKERKAKRMLTQAEKNLTAVREMAHSFNKRRMKAPVQQLPAEILQGIFRMLPRSDFVTAGQVCQYWRSLAKDPSQWRTLKLTERVKHRRDVSRELKFAPYIDTLEILELPSAGVDFSDIHSKVRLVKLLRPLAQGFLKTFGGSFDELEVHNVSMRVFNIVKSFSLQKLVLDFQIIRGSAVESRLVESDTRNTLTSLKCRNSPPHVLESLLRAHAKTLQLLSVRRLRPELDELNSLLLTCKQLKTLTVECRSALRLPPSCDTVTLIVGCHRFALDTKRFSCHGCEAVVAAKNISTLRLVSKCHDDYLAKLDLVWHLNKLEGLISSSLSVFVTCTRLQNPESHQSVSNYLERMSAVRFNYDPSWYDVSWDNFY